MIKVPKNLFFRDDGVYLSNYGKDYFCRIVTEVLMELYQVDNVLYQKRASEDTLKFAFTLKLINRINFDAENCNDYVMYYVDQNYNRLHSEMKYIESELGCGSYRNRPRRTLFDLVIHGRGEINEYPENLIHFEFKGLRNNCNLRHLDWLRLEMTTRNSLCNQVVPRGYFYDGLFNYVSGYQLGIFIKFVNETFGGEIAIFDNGVRRE